jgi:dTDP-4-dehydro-6-deoxy-alpha-D-glucopyranose 2,3-dehydratase
MKFEEALKSYSEFLSIFSNAPSDLLRNEAVIESIKDWSELDSLISIKAWFRAQQDSCSMTIKDIPLMECKDWYYDKNDGVLRHSSGEFFYIQGLRISNTLNREVTSGWDQPVLTQVGLNGGLLGLLRKKINSIPYYLIEAKAEPGNPDKVQISPTLQATFSNLNQAHGGKKPKYSKFFESPETMNATIIFEQWMSEDGGRLYLKRNKGMIVEIDENNTLPDIPPSFKWMTLYQIKYLIKKNSWVGPHIRSIISHL